MNHPLSSGRALPKILRPAAAIRWTSTLLEAAELVRELPERSWAGVCVIVDESPVTYAETMGLVARVGETWFYLVCSARTTPGQPLDNSLILVAYPEGEPNFAHLGRGGRQHHWRSTSHAQHQAQFDRCLLRPLEVSIEEKL